MRSSSNRKAENPRHSRTVRELGDAWTNGDLAKDFPDQIKVRRVVDNNVSRLERHVYPVIGPIRVAALTLADVERVTSSLTGKRPTQRKLSSITRRTIALTLNRTRLALSPDVHSENDVIAGRVFTQARGKRAPRG